MGGLLICHNTEREGPHESPPCNLRLPSFQKHKPKQILSLILHPVWDVLLRIHKTKTLRHECDNSYIPVIFDCGLDACLVSSNCLCVYVSGCLCLCISILVSLCVCLCLPLSVWSLSYFINCIVRQTWVLVEMCSWCGPYRRPTGEMFIMCPCLWWVPMEFWILRLDYFNPLEICWLQFRFFYLKTVSPWISIWWS